MDTRDFDYALPPELIAQVPLAGRDDSRLLHLRRPSGTVVHRAFRELASLLRRGDLLVLNDSRVIPARLLGHKVDTGGKVELLLVRPDSDVATQEALAGSAGGTVWRCLGQASKGLKPGARIVLDGPPANVTAGVSASLGVNGLGASINPLGANGAALAHGERQLVSPSSMQQGSGDASLTAEIVEALGGGEYRVRFTSPLSTLDAAIERAGRLPLPPYITRSPVEDDLERYQTIFAAQKGSVAAPTAGLHFTAQTFAALAAAGVEHTFVTLEVGPGTFLPVREGPLESHHMHAERFSISQSTAEKIRVAKREGRRVVAVGTTVVRTLESQPELRAGSAETSLFITPGFGFRVVDALLTNFHLPKSTLLMLVCAFAGREQTLEAYEAAVRERYRFFSYGDAMLVEDDA